MAKKQNITPVGYYIGKRTPEGDTIIYVPPHTDPDTAKREAAVRAGPDSRTVVTEIPVGIGHAILLILRAVFK